jgi:hypothetical protein
MRICIRIVDAMQFYLLLLVVLIFMLEAILYPQNMDMDVNLVSIAFITLCDRGYLRALGDESKEELCVALSSVRPSKAWSLNEL